MLIVRHFTLAGVSCVFIIASIETELQTHANRNPAKVNDICIEFLCPFPPEAESLTVWICYHVTLQFMHPWGVILTLHLYPYFTDARPSDGTVVEGFQWSRIHRCCKRCQDNGHCWAKTDNVISNYKLQYTFLYFICTLFNSIRNKISYIELYIAE